MAHKIVDLKIVGYSQDKTPKTSTCITVLDTAEATAAAFGEINGGCTADTGFATPVAIKTYIFLK
jgi:hypothetical protein